jgi:hypothetical protein
MHLLGRRSSKERSQDVFEGYREGLLAIEPVGERRCGQARADWIDQRARAG